MLFVKGDKINAADLAPVAALEQITGSRAMQIFLFF